MRHRAELSITAIVIASSACLSPLGTDELPDEGFAAPPATTITLPTATSEPCATPGVHFTVDGAEAVAPALGDRDLAGHKYRGDGHRSPWFTVQGGPLYVHAVGDFLQGDLGRTHLSLLTIKPTGETEGYALVRGGESLIEIIRADGKLLVGRLEADVSKVADTTRGAPSGTPAVRVRGTFCLPSVPANPGDTGA